MFEILCELCLGTHRFSAEPPDRCPHCGGRDSFAGPYIPKARITGPQPADAKQSPYTTAFQDLTRED